MLGAVPVWAIESAVKNNISIAIFTDEHLKACEQTYQRTGIKPKVHVKIDTGMNRIGVRADVAVDFIKKVQKSDFVELKGIFHTLRLQKNLIKQKNKFKSGIM